MFGTFACQPAAGSHDGQQRAFVKPDVGQVGWRLWRKTFSGQGRAAQQRKLVYIGWNARNQAVLGAKRRMVALAQKR